MSAPTRLATFALGLVVAFGAAFGLGRAVGPVDDDPTPPPHPHVTTTTAPSDHDGDHGGEP